MHDMVTVIVGVVALVVGALVSWLIASRATATVRASAAQAATDLAVCRTQLDQARETIDAERRAHEVAVANLESTFENVSNRVLAQTVEQFSQTQERVVRERDAKLDLTLKPLESLLEQYKTSLSTFDLEHRSALSDVHHRASELLAAQQRTQEETRRLNQLLGRSDHRGHWGEVQLANVLEASGLRRGIDYDLQVTGTGDQGRQLRPDCVVRLPRGSSIAVDAKFPFDHFEAALASEDPDERRGLYAEHARALRSHVKTLADKAYWNAIQPAPEFVVCFVPSDVAIAAALEADPSLYDGAAKGRVLITGPTNLLSLLWSVVMVVSQHEAARNAEEILSLAESLVDRIRLVAEPIAKLGRSLDDSVAQYNRAVRSVESRLLPAARGLRRLRAKPGTKSLPELSELHEGTDSLNEQKWGITVGALSDASESAVSDILDLEEMDDAGELGEDSDGAAREAGSAPE
jgi:DNA recombination protein RmuC